MLNRFNKEGYAGVTIFEKRAYFKRYGELRNCVLKEGILGLSSKEGLEEFISLADYVAMESTGDYVILEAQYYKSQAQRILDILNS